MGKAGRPKKAAVVAVTPDAEGVVTEIEPVRYDSVRDQFVRRFASELVNERVRSGVKVHESFVDEALALANRMADRLGYEAD